MEKWRSVKARKDHLCEACECIIAKGELYDLLRARTPRWDENDNQIGIEFIQMRIHPSEQNCHWPEECKKGNHIEHYYTDNHPDSPNYGDTSCYCVNCATDLSDIEQTNPITN